jgi:hypothetical protein
MLLQLPQLLLLLPQLLLMAGSSPIVSGGVVVEFQVLGVSVLVRLHCSRHKQHNNTHTSISPSSEQQWYAQ